MGVSLDGFVASAPDGSGQSTPVFARSTEQPAELDGGWDLPPEAPKLTQRKLARLRDLTFAGGTAVHVYQPG
jgi:hypothetical protein